MADPIALEMYKSILESCAAEYDQTIRVFQVLDSKAQATAATAGVLLAAAFAFGRDLNARMPMAALYKSLSVATIALLLVAVLFAILGTWIQKVPWRPTVEFERQLILDLVNAEGSEAIGARAAGFYGDEIRAWIPRLQQMQIVIHKKSRLVAYSQSFLLLSLVCVSALTITFIIGA